MEEWKALKSLHASKEWPIFYMTIQKSKSRSAQTVSNYQKSFQASNRTKTLKVISNLKYLQIELQIHFGWSNWKIPPLSKPI